MATFVETLTEEEEVLTLVQYVSNLKKKKDPEGDSATQYSNECTRLVQESRTRDVILKLISDTDAIFSDQNDKEIEACLSVLSSLIKKLEPEVADAVGQKLREAVAANTSDRPLLRLKILTNIYHAFDANSLSRYETFVTLAKYAHESNNAELMIPKFKQVDKWLSDWGANTEQSRKLFTLIRQILKDNHRSAQAHKYAVKMLQTFKGDDASSPEAKGLAVEAVLEAITYEELFQCDHLLALTSVQALEKDEKYASLYKLLQIFAQDKLDTFQAFVREHPGYLESLGINEEQSTHKMRLLSLASLGSEHEIPYSLIASTLQIPTEEVESWVITAVSAKLLEVKMNQLKQTVSVGFCVQRVFTQTQWATLSTQLRKWQTSVKQLLGTVNQIQAVHVQ
jgi:translation initiation factor 3 subunit M